MSTYRKKPVVIDAAGPLDADNAWGISEWCKGVSVHEDGKPTGAVVIDTLEGAMRGDPGDYIIRGVQGEFYPCKPEISAATYEAV